MKFYKRNSLNPKDPMSNNFAVDSNGMILTKSVIGMELPAGSTANRPGGTNYPTEPLVSGTVRYNSDLRDLEVYERNQWERIRTVRPATITVQNLGNGDYSSTVFGPLNSDYTASYTAGAQNIMVYVDNVYQIPVTNYDLELTPASITETLAAPAYTGTNTVQVVAGIGSPLTNIITATVGTMLVTGIGIQTGTTIIRTFSERIINPTATNYYFVFSNPVTRTLNSASTFLVSYTTGTYILFTGAVPSKPVVALLGFDGYFPAG
jgi:hypothetical protein